MKRLVPVLALLSLLIGLAWWQREPIAGHLAAAVPAAAPALSKVLGVVDAKAQTAGGARAAGAPAPAPVE